MDPVSLERPLSEKYGSEKKEVIFFTNSMGLEEIVRYRPLTFVIKAVENAQRDFIESINYQIGDIGTHSIMGIRSDVYSIGFSISKMRRLVSNLKFRPEHIKDEINSLISDPLETESKKPYSREEELDILSIFLTDKIMPSTVSDIHEISVLIGIQNSCVVSEKTEKKFSVFQEFSLKYGQGKINVSIEDFKKNEQLFNRGLNLASILKKRYGLEGETLEWYGVKNHKEDSSDILVDGKGISLKDSSKIIRNSGFEQLLDTFCKSPLKRFKDPFWEFAPNLSVDYLHTVIKDCARRNVFEIKNAYIHINGKQRKKFKGTVSNILLMNLAEIVSIISKLDIKNLVKDFSINGKVEELLQIRNSLVKKVSKKVTSVLREGLLQDPSHFAKKVKYMLQYRDEEKLFGFSSAKSIYVGKIKTNKEVIIMPKDIFAKDSKLPKKTTGLQVNIYTEIQIIFPNGKETVKLQNQLRYKHRTFSCAPEANFHLLDYDDWRKLYPET